MVGVDTASLSAVRGWQSAIHSPVTSTALLRGSNLTSGYEARVFTERLNQSFQVALKHRDTSRSTPQDGVVVVAREEAEWGLEKSNERLSKEEATRAKLEAGELGLDFYGLRTKLTDMGVEWID